MYKNKAFLTLPDRWQLFSQEYAEGDKLSTIHGALRQLIKLALLISEDELSLILVHGRTNRGVLYTSTTAQRGSNVRSYPVTDHYS